MMNFGTISTISANTSNYLRPWNIYKNVKFDGIGDVVEGKTKDGNIWRAWDFTFSSPEGSYKERVFEPLNNDRKVYTNKNGHESELPSSHERFLIFAMQLIDAYAPTKMDKFKEFCGKLDKEPNVHAQYDKFIGALKTVLKDSEITADLLLVGRTNDNKVYAALPNFCAINGTTKEPFISERFVGKNLGFSSYELGKQKEYLAAKPTPMKTTETGSEAEAEPKIEQSKSEDIEDFDSLL